MTAADQYAAYAAARSLEQGGPTPVPGATPLLCAGTDQRAERTFVGELPGGRSGMLAYYSYLDHSGKYSSRLDFTIVLLEVPEAAGFLHEVSFERYVGADITDFLDRRQRVSLESEDLADRVEIFIGQHDDPNRARQLFSPVFVEWLAHSTKDIYFELEDGYLVVYSRYLVAPRQGFDWLCNAASYIADRISAEALESDPAAANAPVRFDPRTALTPVPTGGHTRWYERRVLVITAIALGALILIVGGIRSNSEDDGDIDSVSEAQEAIGNPDFPSAEELLAPDPSLAEHNQVLLSAFASTNGGEGVDPEDLYDAGPERREVNNWFTYAEDEGLIEFNLDGFAYDLTPEGEGTLEELEG